MYSFFSYTQLGSPFRQPVLKFALKFPSNTVDFFLCRLFDSSLSRFFLYFLREKDGVPLVESLSSSPQKIISTTFTLAVSLRHVEEGVIFFKFISVQ